MKVRNCGTQQVRRLYLTKKNLRTWLFRNRIIQLQNVSIPQKMEMSQLKKRGSDDYLGFASVVNKNCNDFKLGELSADNFKCQIFAQGLVSAKNAEIRLVTTKKKKHPVLATAVENYIGPRTVPIVQKNVETAINSDIRAVWKQKNN